MPRRQPLEVPSQGRLARPAHGSPFCRLARLSAATPSRQVEGTRSVWSRLAQEQRTQRWAPVRHKTQLVLERCTRPRALVRHMQQLVLERYTRPRALVRRTLRVPPTSRSPRELTPWQTAQLLRRVRSEERTCLTRMCVDYQNNRNCP